MRPQVRGWCCSRGARGRHRTGAGPEGWLWPSSSSRPHTHNNYIYNCALIMSLGGSLPMRLGNCKLTHEAGLNSARPDPPCCCSCHCSPNWNAAAGIIFFAARARKTHQ